MLLTETFPQQQGMGVRHETTTRRESHEYLLF